MHLLTSILLLIVVSRLLGELMVRINQPRIVGELLSGIVLGPAVLNLVRPTEHLAGIAELSVFLIVLSAGLEMEFRDVLRAIKGRGFVAASLDFFVPLSAGILVGSYFNLGVIQTVFLGLCISITALPVAIRILADFKLLNSNIARYSIATAILNDVAALLMLGVILDMGKDPAMSSATFSVVAVSTLKTAAKLLLFAVVVFIAARLLWWGGRKTRYIEGAIEKMMGFFGREALFGVAVMFVLLFGSMSEQLGSHFVIGAFFGALLLSRDIFGSSLFSELENILNSITSGFLAPIFLAYLGLHVSSHPFGTPLFLVTVLVVSVASKISAGYLGAKWIKMTTVESLGVGIILNGRGIMELVVANIAYQRGMIDQDLFSVLVVMGIFTTVITPILFRQFVLKKLPATA